MEESGREMLELSYLEDNAERIQRWFHEYVITRVSNLAYHLRYMLWSITYGGKLIMDTTNAVGIL